MTDIRYYRGKVKMQIIKIAGKKAIVKYLEPGIVGPKAMRKFVLTGDVDTTLIRHCWRNRKQFPI